MPVTTSQQISRYFENFKQSEITFNAQVNEVLGLLPRQVYLKCVNEIYPCVLYSSSMLEAKVVAHLRPAAFQGIRAANNIVSLHYAFQLKDKTDPLSFFVGGKITGYTPYNKNNPDVHFITINYPQKPPDDLIEIFGRLLEANTNAKRRKEERIIITPDSMRILSLNAKEATITIEKVPRKCIVRDLSFSGAKVLIFGIAKFLVGKTAELELFFGEQKERIIVPGKVLRFEPVQDRKDIAAIALLFTEDKVPIAYKMKINEAMHSQRLTVHPLPDSP